MKLNLIESMTYLQQKNINIEKLDSNLKFAILRYSSADRMNLTKVSKYLNRVFFYIHSDVFFGVLNIAMNKKIVSFYNKTEGKMTCYYPFKYPKAEKGEKELFTIIENYYIQKFNYGKNDLKQIRPFIIDLMNNKDELEEFALIIGMENNIRKKFNLSLIVKPKLNNSNKSKPKSNLDKFLNV